METKPQTSYEPPTVEDLGRLEEITKAADGMGAGEMSGIKT